MFRDPNNTLKIPTKLERDDFVSILWAICDDKTFLVCYIYMMQFFNDLNNKISRDVLVSIQRQIQPMF